MGWFFGCFGGGGKKARKHGPPLSSQKLSQKSSQPLPVRMPPSLSIPIKKFPVREEATSSEDHFKARQFPNSAPVRRAEGILLPETRERTPEKQKKDDPWSQLDELEEELEDLRKQIDRETHDAKKIKEEVTFLRSCGTLLQTPSELRKKAKQSETQQNSMPLKGWHSWLVPSSSPTPKSQLEKRHANEDLQAASSSSTPVKECGGILHRLQTPVFNKMKNQINLQVVSPVIPKHDPRSNLPMQEKHGIAHVLLDFQDECNPTSSMTALEGLVESNGVSEINATESPCRQGISDLSSALSKQLDGSVADATLTVNSSTTKRDVRKVTPIQESQILKLSTENAKSSGEKRSSNQKKLNLIPPPDLAEEDKETDTKLESLHQIHTFQCDTVSSRRDSTGFGTKSTSIDMKGTSQFAKHRYNTADSTSSASQMIPQSPSLSVRAGYSRQSPASQTKSVSFTSTYHDHGATSDELSHGNGVIEDKYSGESYINSSCFERDDESRFDALASTSSSSSMDSEETVSDLAPEHCCSPSVSLTWHESITSCKGDDSPASSFAEETAVATHHSHGSSQYSCVQGSWRTQAARYDNVDEKTEDDNLFSDAMSYVSSECGEKPNGSRLEHMDSIKSGDQESVRTPEKVPECLATFKAGKPSRMRSKPASPVLTPVENMSQWKQLKVRDNSDMGLKSSGQFFSRIDASLKKQMLEYTGEETRKNGWDENKHGIWTDSMHSNECGKQMETCGSTAKAEFIRVNTSLSHWLKPSSKQDEAEFGLESQAAMSRNHTSPSLLKAENESRVWTERLHSHACVEQADDSSGSASEAQPICVDTSLSHWLNPSSKQDEAGCDLVSPAALLRHHTPSSFMQGQHSPSGMASGRPTLGISSGDNYSTIAMRRAQWDVKGIPNSATKYNGVWTSNPDNQR